MVTSAQMRRKSPSWNSRATRSHDSASTTSQGLSNRSIASPAVIRGADLSLGLWERLKRDPVGAPHHGAEGVFGPPPMSVLPSLPSLGVGDRRGGDGARGGRETRATVHRHWHTDWHTNGPKRAAEPGNRTRTRVTPQRFLRPPRLPFRQPGPPIL
jgi:hypothetical protein